MMRRSFKVFADNYCCGIHNMSVVFHIKAVRAGTMIIRPAATASRDNLRIREDQSFSLWPRERPQEKPLTTIIYYQQPLVPDGTTRPLCHLLPRMEGKLTVFVTTTCLLAATIAIGELNPAPAPLALPIPYYNNIFIHYTTQLMELPCPVSKSAC